MKNKPQSFVVGDANIAKNHDKKGTRISYR